MSDTGKEAVERARTSHQRIMMAVSKGIGLDESPVPAVAREMARYLAHGHVSFNIDISDFLKEESIQEIEEAFEQGFHPLMVAAGWMYSVEEAGLIFGVDEMWIDPSATHAHAFLEEGLISVLVVRPGSGRIVLRTDATDFFIKQGWRIVPQDRFEAKAEEAYGKYYEYLDDASGVAAV